MFSSVPRSAALACAAILFTFGIAVAGSPHDGTWSLSIVTKQGTCDPAYQFGIQIVDGAVTSQGPGRFSGRVSADGGVRVSVSAGEKQASGSGKLSQTSGSGRWTGKSGDARCSGIWTAQRL